MCTEAAGVEAKELCSFGYAQGTTRVKPFRRDGRDLRRSYEADALSS